VLTLAPRRYNELYKQMRSEGKNLNAMLAWSHARVIEDLIGTGLHPNFVLSDQFGDKRYIERRLMVDTRLSAVPVLQMHRAEADVGVAAASILARDGFLRWIDQTSRALGMTVPKGAGPPVIQAARTLVARIGADSLKEYAKVSFKTMEKVLAP
jgi:ribonuclease HIII